MYIRVGMRIVAIWVMASQLAASMTSLLVTPGSRDTDQFAARYSWTFLGSTLLVGSALWLLAGLLGSKAQVPSDGYGTSELNARKLMRVGTALIGVYFMATGGLHILSDTILLLNPAPNAAANSVDPWGVTPKKEWSDIFRTSGLSVLVGILLFVGKDALTGTAKKASSFWSVGEEEKS